VRSFLKLSIPTVAAALLLAACGGSSSGGGGYGGGAAGNAIPTASVSAAGGAVTVKATPNSSLGSTVLVDQQGLTLYRLSGEQAGKFICTAACLKIWHPLTVTSGAKPAGGVGGLGIIKRPDGKQQVTYKGMPLYTFAQDQSAGQAKGQGIKDVGTWNAVSTGGSATTKTPAPSTPAPSGGRNYAY
jgi:predicted lipoprotein with Yx(FWY)xxD motif